MPGSTTVEIEGRARRLWTLKLASLLMRLVAFEWRIRGGKWRQVPIHIEIRSGL